MFIQLKYYSARKKNEPLLFKTTWMNLTEIKLSQRSQTWKSTLYYDSIYKNRETNLWFLRSNNGYRGEWKTFTGRGQKWSSGMLEMFHILIWVDEYTYENNLIKLHTYDFVDFAVCKL